MTEHTSTATTPTTEPLPVLHQTCVTPSGTHVVFRLPDGRIWIMGDDDPE